MPQSKSKAALDSLFQPASHPPIGEQRIPLELIDPNPNLFEPIDENSPEVISLAEQLQDKEIHTSIKLRALSNGRYEIIDGHRRFLASKIAGKKSIPSEVRNITEEEAKAEYADSVLLQRKEFHHMVVARAVKLKYEVLKHQGKRLPFLDEETCAHDGHKLKRQKSRDEVAADFGMGHTSVHRYYRLNFLIPPLQTMVDAGSLKMTPAEQISHLSRDQQHSIHDYLIQAERTPSLPQAKKIRAEAQKAKTLSDEMLDQIMVDIPGPKPLPTNGKRDLVIPYKEVSKYFGGEVNVDQIHKLFLDFVQFYSKKKQRHQQMAR